MSIKSVAVIPARAGSKRIPLKNLISLDNMPLIGHAITSAKDSGAFDIVMVTTESPKIAEVAKQFDADVPELREENLADDVTPTIDVVKDAIQMLERKHNADIEIVTCLYATAVLISPERISEAFEFFSKSDQINFLVSVQKEDSRLLRGLFSEGGNLIKPVNNDFVSFRSQDLPSLFRDAGCMYIGRSSSWKNSSDILTGQNIGFQLGPDEAVDLDEVDDLAELEVKWRLRCKN